jgi:hypothetical protein
MFLVVENRIINMDKVAVIYSRKIANDTLDISICTTAITEWAVHNPGVGPGFSPLDINFRTNEETWDNLIMALKNNERVFILE